MYEFPLDEKASVSKFWAEIDDQRIDGTVKEKEEAKNIYDDAIASGTLSLNLRILGHGAYLLEECNK